MAEGTEGRHRHFVLEDITETDVYRSPQQRRGRPDIPEQDRARHGGELQRQLSEIRTEAETARRAQQAVGIQEDGLGLQIEFESFSEVELAFESLARERSGIELLNVRHEEEGNRTLATVFVPDGKLDHFENLIRDYLAEKRDSAGRARDNRKLIDAIQQIRVASLRALWTDSDEVLPTDDEEPFWWEVWLPVRGNRYATTNVFRERAEAQGMRVAPGEVAFLERTVLLTFASVDQMQRSIVTLNSIAELRRAKETADFFDSLRADEQREWLEDLLARAQYTPDGRRNPPCLSARHGRQSRPPAAWPRAGGQRSAFR